MDLNALNFLRRPLGAQRDPTLVSESGRPVYRDAAGNVFEVAPQPSRNALAAMAMMEAAQAGQAFDPILSQRDTTTPINALAALAQGAMDGVTAPGRAMRGEPVTYGDVWATALDYGALGAPMRAPEGASRAGAMRSADDLAETPAQAVARLLREGRASEVTDDMMAQVDPQEMYRLYESGATGQPMPMDVASRMARAEAMGFDMMQDFYHGTAKEGYVDTTDIKAFDPGRVGDRWNADSRGFSVTSAPRDANYYATRSDSSKGNMGDGMIYPLMDKSQSPYNMRVGSLDGTISTWDDRAADTYQRMDAAGADHARLYDSGNNVEMRVIMDPRNIRSRFARFDPRLSHLANLSSGAAGAAVLGGNAQEIEAYLSELGL